MDEPLVLKLLFLWMGNLSMWIYHGGSKTIDEVSKENNYTVGLIVSIVLGFLFFFLYS